MSGREKKMTRDAWLDRDRCRLLLYDSIEPLLAADPRKIQCGGERQLLPWPQTRVLCVVSGMGVNDARAADSRTERDDNHLRTRSESNDNI